MEKIKSVLVVDLTRSNTLPEFLNDRFSLTILENLAFFVYGETSICKAGFDNALRITKANSCIGLVIVSSLYTAF